LQLAVLEEDLITLADTLVVVVVLEGLFMEQYQVQHLLQEHILLMLVLVVLVVLVVVDHQTILV
jgi:hypothetical protein